MATLVLCPSRGRPEHAARLLATFTETRWDPASRLVFVVDDDDPKRGQYPGEVYVVPATGSMGGALRKAAADQALLADATSVGVVGDDCAFRSYAWDQVIDGWLRDHPGIAWPNDGWEHPWALEAKASHWWLSRVVVDGMGIAPPTQHLWMDDYWAQLGWAAGCARVFPDVVVEHLHPMAGKGEKDQTYKRHERWIGDDRTWWQGWQRGGKKQDVRRLRDILGKPTPVRVFADWHHPALWEALSIVFEDRFGWELYSPVGPEWLRQRIWTFANGTPGWSADCYLVPPGPEPEYPQRVRKTVTLDQFEALDWDIVIASVGVHQRPFHQLARQRGARFVHHIGDAKRRIDSILRQTIIASAAVRRADVIHHQEFDRQLFAPGPPTDRRAVTSLMLRLDSTSGPYQWLADALGERWSAVRCEAMRGPGYLAPMSEVAERMRAAGWLWHDKRIGDGYGHVLFTAAHMGRPLIGHASHYAGLLGERLWEDGVTCIDLDRHEPSEVLAILGGMTDDRYAEMAAAIQARFASLVDFEAEAEAIRRALA